jgi:thiol-disulfide isomerase/thioredoxin
MRGAVTPQDLKTVLGYPFRNPATKITLLKGIGTTGEKFASFCNQLVEKAPHISVKNDSDLPFEAPVMVIGRHGNIAYHALPTGKILVLFLESLDRSADSAKLPAEETKNPSQAIDLPAGFKLYVADQCPHCPQTLRQMQALADTTPMIRLRVINAELFPEMARNDNIRSVPSLLLEDQFRWTGQVDTEELLTICANRDPSQLSADSLRQLIEEGHAEQVASMMKESGQLFPALVDLVIHPRWSVRLGAMVAVEYLAEGAPELGLHLCQSLWRAFPDLAAQVQGDTTHIFGLFNDKRTRSYLQTITKGNFGEEVREAAQEALELIASG